MDPPPMKRAILRAFYLVVRTKVQKSPPRMKLFSGIKINSWENLAMNSTIKKSDTLAVIDKYNFCDYKTDMATL